MTTKPRMNARCSECGRRGYVTHIPYVCRECKNYAKRDEIDPRGFQGRRVRDGLIWRFIPDPPEEDLIDILARNLSDPLTLLTPHALCECGCLLPKSSSRCPNCLVWATKDAVLHSWKASEIAWTEAA